MKQMQFVGCSATECPFNEMKQCRAPYITMDKEGKCMIMDGGPFEGKAEIERHVEIRSCACETCAHFERDELTNVGGCGLYEPLFFSRTLSQEGGPVCSTFAKQIDAPPYATKI
jgi:hypothetical protein